MPRNVFRKGVIGTTAQLIDLGQEFAHSQIVNDGSASIHTDPDGETIPDTASQEIAAGETLQLPRPTSELVKGRRFIYLVAASGSQTYRIYGWN